MNTEPKTPKTIFDVVVAEESKNGRTYWKTVGVAFPLLNGGTGLRLKLDMFPGLRLYVKESLKSAGPNKADQEVDQTEVVPF